MKYCKFLALLTLGFGAFLCVTTDNVWAADDKTFWEQVATNSDNTSADDKTTNSESKEVLPPLLPESTGNNGTIWQQMNTESGGNAADNNTAPASASAPAPASASAPAPASASAPAPAPATTTANDSGNSAGSVPTISLENLKKASDLINADKSSTPSSGAATAGGAGNASAQSDEGAAKSGTISSTIGKITAPKSDSKVSGGGPSIASLASNSGDIFGKLSGKAAIIGTGLQKAGFLIAGLGLIVFSFMAIFNKVSWKNLAYIMMSCFILSFMVLVINFVREKGDQNIDVSFGGAQNAAATEIQGGSMPTVKK